MRRFLCCLLVIAGLGLAGRASAQWLLVPMDLTQQNHLKAYGLAFAVLERGGTVHWLLNYRGGSFLTRDDPVVVSDARLRGVSIERITDAQKREIDATVGQENMDDVLLEKAPRIAVYVPPNFQPWDDAVTLALNYAEIPFETVFDREVLAGKLSRYDWLHLHHEDFTGQFGKFYASYRNAPWYLQQKALLEQMAASLGFETVWQLKHAVAVKIRDYVQQGGFLFAMCSATDTIDIALAFLGTDIVAPELDGTPVDPLYAEKVDWSRTFAFQHFHVITNPLVYEYSDIDTSDYSRLRGPEGDYFTLFDFAAKYDPVPAMLTQCHVNVVNGFMGQTTGFHRRFLKRDVVVLAEVEGTDEVRYIHGKRGRGTFTFLGGHDPEDYQHAVGDPPTDLDLFRTSPGYRLILNNVLFPAARKKPLKT